MYALGIINEQSVGEASDILSQLVKDKDIVSINGVTVCDATEISIEETFGENDETFGVLQIGQKHNSCVLNSFKNLLVEVHSSNNLKILSLKTTSDFEEDACNGVTLDSNDPAEVNATECALNILLQRVEAVKISDVIIRDITHIEVRAKSEHDTANIAHCKESNGDYIAILLNAEKHDLIANTQQGSTRLLHLNIFDKEPLDEH